MTSGQLIQVRAISLSKTIALQNDRVNSARLPLLLAAVNQHEARESI